MPLDDPFLRKPNINKAKKYLKWKPKIQIKEGLNKTIRFFNSID